MRSRYLVILAEITGIFLLVSSYTIWKNGFSSGLHIAGGLFFLCLFPGLSVSYIFWRPSELKNMERVLLSIGLSLALVPATTYVFSKLGWLINTKSTAIVVGGFIVVGIVGTIARNHWPRVLNVFRR